MTTKILLAALSEEMLDDDALLNLQERVPAMTVMRMHDASEIEDKVNDIEIVVGSVPYDLVPRMPSLRWVQLWGAGADWLVERPHLQDLDFVLTNASGVHSVPISEHIFAFLLSFGRQFPQAIRAQNEGAWIANSRHGERPTTNRAGEATDYSIGKNLVCELFDKTMLLIGVGAIGERTAEIAHAFGMRVIGLRRNPSRTIASIDRMVGPTQLLDVLPGADFVVITAPLTPETIGMVDKRAFAVMKRSAYLVNIGRGGTIVESDLIEALRNGAIAGAGLDVFAEEPLPADSPLWAMENVTITSHYSGLTPAYDARAMAIFLDNLERYQRGEPLRNVVDKRLAY